MGILCRLRPHLIALDCGESNLDVGARYVGQKHLARWDCKSSSVGIVELQAKSFKQWEFTYEMAVRP
jgi:hypothetical protein